MIVRFGYVAMSTVVKNASPSKTMTATHFNNLVDREAAVRRLERIAAENLHNTLRILFHNRAYDIWLYRLSSKLIPLIGNEELIDWDPLPALVEEFAAIGDYVKEHKMRVSFHPDHFTVLSTPRADVLQKTKIVLDQHVRMLEAMGLDGHPCCNIHIGGTYGSRQKSLERFMTQFSELEPRIQRSITLENDDKTFNAKETLFACQQLNVPMVLDIHHHNLNNGGEDLLELWPEIAQTWEVNKKLPPKIHFSSPKGDKDQKGHADYINADDLLVFLRSIAPSTEALDVMVDAKKRDTALMQLMRDLQDVEGVKILNQASVQILPLN